MWVANGVRLAYGLGMDQKQKLTVRLSVLMTKADKLKLDAAAEKAHVGAGTYARQTIMREVNENEE